jgi:hypothetical protein
MQQLGQLIALIATTDRPLRLGTIRLVILSLRHHRAMSNEIVHTLVDYFAKFRVDWCDELDQEAYKTEGYKLALIREAEETLDQFKRPSKEAPLDRIGGVLASRVLLSDSKYRATHRRKVELIIRKIPNTQDKFGALHRRFHSNSRM